MKQKIASLFIVLFISGNLLFGQDYKTSLGFRGGWTSGITFKHFIEEDAAIEAIFSSGWRSWTGYQFAVLYEKHKAAFTQKEVEGFFWFYGAGAHFGTSYRVWRHKGNYNEGYWEGYSTFGVDGIFGLEYKVEEIPITIGLDVKPFIEFSTRPHVPFGFWDSAFSIRYVF